MDSVVFEGKEYTKASVLAARFRYTQDYLGQLCRGKKVDARLVGRAWYINLDSLEGHRTGRYKNLTKTAEISPQKSSNHYSSRIDVEPVLKNKTVKIFRERKGVITEIPVRYERDEYSLIPKVNKTAVTASLPVLPAEAERLKIKKGPKKFNVTDFKAEALPEVSLSGTVKVDGIPEVLESIEEETKSRPADISNELKTERTISATPRRLVSVRQPMRRVTKKNSVDMRPTTENSVKAPIQVATQPRKVLIKVSPRQSKVPRRSMSEIQPASNPKPVEKSPVPNKIQPHEVKFSPHVVVSKKVVTEETSKVSGFWLALLVFLGATLVSFVVLVTKREVSVEGGLYTDHLSFDLSVLVDIFTTLFR
jgi:hypothetical protein